MRLIRLLRASVGPFETWAIWKLTILANQSRMVRPSRRISGGIAFLVDHRNLVGSACSADDDRSQHAPVGLAGVEQGSDPVVLEVAEPKADPFDALDQVVEGFGRTVRDVGDMEVDDLGEPVPNGAAQPADLRRHRLFGGPSESGGVCLLSGRRSIRARASWA